MDRSWFTIRHVLVEKLRLVTLSLPDGRVVWRRLDFRRWVVLAAYSGRAVLMRLSKPVLPWAAHFNQPVIQPVGAVDQRVRLPDDPDQIVVADSRKNLYRLRVGEQIRRRWRRRN